MEPAGNDRGPQPLARGRPRPPPAAPSRRPPAALALRDPGQHPAAELRALRIETGRAPRFLSALSGQRVAPGFRPARYPDPDDAAPGQEPLRRALMQPRANPAGTRGTPANSRPP